ncbi:DUF421 domain-containing protein [Paenibacillus albiflavus]|uniref:DUF421 domain-containing protein n=2 Tax=Paenibacillus albiflavus TaxID=2545760 RepID=A0A4R4EGJ2_9BACL|nr:DUF421 domain-containing protein [Paenibacillus albiflavus]
MFIFTRILGKRQISQLTFFEYITGITIGDLAGFISTDIEANYLHGLSALMMWFIIPFTIEWWMMKQRRMRIVFEGKDRVLIQDGKILEDNLKKERITGDELLEQLRMKDVFDLTEVEYAVLETSGALSVLLKPEFRPLTPLHMQMKVPGERQPIEVIMDGEVLNEGLRLAGFTREWLFTELDKLGVTQANVFLAQVDAFGQLYVDVYDDTLEIPLPQALFLLYANLKKVQADLELFALATQNKVVSTMYGDCAQQMDDVVESFKTMIRT